MKKTTLNKYLELLLNIKNSGLSVSAYCKQNNINPQNIYNVIHEIRNDLEDRSEVSEQILDIYEELTGATVDEEVDTANKAEVAYERDAEGKIKAYKYKIYRKNRRPLVGSLSREEMVNVYRLYTVYGDNLTAKSVSRYFPDLSVVDIKRIFSAFSIYKHSSPFPPHYYEEKTEEELREIQSQERENSFMRKAEEDRIKDTEKLLKKFAQENIELKKQLEKATGFNITIPKNIKPVVLQEYEPVGQSINIYLSDIHLGSCVTSGSLYKENENYGFDEAKRRLTVVLEKLREFDCFDTVNIVLMGDNIDCSGFFGKTARLDHDMPENMDPREQANKYIELIMWFIASLTANDNDITSNINVYSVPCGNHRK